MQLVDIVKDYLRSLESEYRCALSDKQHTPELSFRISLHTLFERLADLYVGPNEATIVLEPKSQNRVGRPDWRIHNAKTLGIYGYVEGKALSLDQFNIAAHSEQFERYLTLGHKLVITDGIDFAYQFPGDQSITVISIVDKSTLSRRTWASNGVNPEFQLFAQKFFCEPNPTIYQEEELICQIAIRARCLANEIEKYKGIAIDEAMNADERRNILSVTRLHNELCGSADLSFLADKTFAEYVAQGIIFDLWHAHRRLCSIDDDAIEKREKLNNYAFGKANFCSENRLLRDLLRSACRDEEGFILEWIRECIDYLSFVHVTDEFRIRPDYRRLYETFFLEFNRASRFDYGAYYMPKAVAACLVTLTNVALSKAAGSSLVDSNLGMILDPCFGTGSLIESALESGVAPTKIAGFEILPAPYALAEYRLCSSGISESSPQLFLVNTLGDGLYSYRLDNSLRGREQAAASSFLESSEISVVLGNPPCSESFKAVTKEHETRINELVDELRPQRRRARSNLERQMNNTWLQFFRWSCDALERTNGPSALSLVLPSSFLEADSFTPARLYLLDHFAEIYVLEIDGATRSGIRADNLFRTQQGRCIIVAARKDKSCVGHGLVRHFSAVSMRRDSKNAYLSNFSDGSIDDFFIFEPSETSAYAFIPSLPFDEKTYSRFWPLKSDNEPAVFKKVISGMKLSPISLFVHAKLPMLRRRTREIAQNVGGSKKWFKGWDREPSSETLDRFSAYWNDEGTADDDLLRNSCKRYSLRPFLTASALLDEALTKELARVGGGGTRLRPELFRAFSKDGTFGIAVSPSPKDQHENLKQFSSFCWHYPDNDLCRRGSARIYCNQLFDRKTGREIDNVSDDLVLSLLRTFGYSGEEPLRDTAVFYTYAILCSRLYLDAFEGALYTVCRTDQSPRIPFVADRGTYDRIVALGKRLALLEKDDYEPGNLLGFDYAALSARLPDSFKLHLSDEMFNPEEGTVTLSSRNGDELVAPCPQEIQDISIGGYDVIKNAWLKFYSYDYTHCYFDNEDLEDFLSLLNRLAEYLQVLDELDNTVRDVICGKAPLIQPTNATD